MRELAICEMYHVSGRADDDFYCPCCEGIEELENQPTQNTPSLVGAGFGDGGYSSAFYNEQTGQQSPVSEVIINTIDSVGNFLNDFNNTVSGPPIR